MQCEAGLRQHVYRAPSQSHSSHDVRDDRLSARLYPRISSNTLDVARRSFHDHAMLDESDCCWQHPWLRVSLVIRVMLGTRWDAEAWPQVKVEFKKALALRSQIRRSGWFN